MLDSLNWAVHHKFEGFVLLTNFELFFRTNFMIFLKKISNTTLRDNAEKIFESFVHQKFQWQINSSSFQNDALKNLFVRYSTAQPSSAAVEREFALGKDILNPKKAGLSDNHFEILIFLKVNRCSQFWFVVLFQ